MRYIKQGFWVLVFSVAGEAARYLIPLPIPASIYGLALPLYRQWRYLRGNAAAILC